MEVENLQEGHWFRDRGRPGKEERHRERRTIRVRATLYDRKRGKRCPIGLNMRVDKGNVRKLNMLMKNSCASKDQEERMIIDSPFEDSEEDDYESYEDEEEKRPKRRLDDVMEMENEDDIERTEEEEEERKHSRLDLDTDDSSSQESEEEEEDEDEDEDDGDMEEVEREGDISREMLYKDHSHQARSNSQMTYEFDFKTDDMRVIDDPLRFDHEPEKKCKSRFSSVTSHLHPNHQIVSISALPIEEPIGVKLTAITPQDIINSSVLEVTVVGLRGECGSVTDPRLGPTHVESSIPCATCTTSECLGHNGYIDLREYIFHPAFITRCLQTLRKLCYHCLGPVVTCQRNLEKLRKANTFRRHHPTLTKMWMGKQYSLEPPEEPNQRLCAKKQPKFSAVLREGIKRIQVKVESKVVELSASTIREIFAEVSDRTWQYLGMKDPSNEVFIRYLRVCPTSCRSAAEVDGQLTPNTITVLYNEVVKVRNELDQTNLKMKELMMGQDEVVRTGVKIYLSKLLNPLIDSQDLFDASTAPLNEGRGASSTFGKFCDDESISHKQNGIDATTEGLDPIDDILLKGLNFISEDSMEDKKEEEEYLDNVDKGEDIYIKENNFIKPATPPLAEWLLTFDDDDETDISECEEQETKSKQEDGTKKKLKKDTRVKRGDKLRLVKFQIQEMAERMSKLHQQANKQLLALTSSVAIVVHEHMAKIPGKNNVLRHHLLGKRVNQCARAVFTGDNSLPLGVVGVPRTIAAKLFQQVHIHDSNISNYQKMLDRFPKYPCIISVTRGDKHFDMQTLKNKITKSNNLSISAFRLRIGDVVQRHLMDGDQVVVNRQPTLAKANMVTHKVRIVDSRTISLNTSITDNYAADCDGDEMNLFVPGVESHSSRMLDVSHNTIFSKNGKVSLKIKQDALRGAYIASLRNTFLTLEEFKALMLTDSQVPPPAILKPHRLWTGLQLLSLALPPKLTVDQVGVSMQLDTLVVRQGHILSGVFDKSGQDKILECCKLFLGHEVIMVTVKALQAIAERFVDEVGGIGFSFLPEDWSCDPGTLDTLRHELQYVLKRAQNIKCPQRRNAKLRQLLVDQASKLVQQLRKESSAAAMLKAGSKKRPQKLAQVCLAVGQHNMNDHLPEKHLDGYRILPFFRKDDTRPQAEGFVDQPLLGVGSITADALSGIVARSSTYKKHCATGESGYLQRKLGKLMEDLTVRHDGTVRDANDEIVQLLYGDDGLLPECCVTVTLNTEPLPSYLSKFYQKLICNNRLSNKERLMLKEELCLMWSDRYFLMKCAEKGRIDASVPFDLPLLMGYVLATVPVSGPPPSIEDVIMGINKFFVFMDEATEKPMSDELLFCKKEWERMLETQNQQAEAADKAGYPLKLRSRYTSDGKLYEINLNRRFKGIPQKKVCDTEHRMMRDPLHMLKRYVREHVNTYTIRKADFSKQQFSALLEIMRDLYQESRPAAGECVGALAAQALAEPLMQMTLNACHRAAVASDGDAIPRLTELLNGQAEDAVLELRQGGLLHAREYLVQEISQVYTLSGETIDVRHVRLVVDYMLKEGTMKGFTRHHIPRQVSFLKAAAFEQPLTLLQQAGTRNRSDNLLGVSENLIFDKPVDVGPDACSTMTWLDLKTDTPVTPNPLDSQSQLPSQSPAHSLQSK